MLMIILHFILFASHFPVTETTQIYQDQQFCPITRNINPLVYNVLAYPQEFYRDTNLPHNLIWYNCSDFDDDHNNVRGKEQCLQKQPICPLHSKNVKSTLESLIWQNLSPRLCSLIFKNKEKNQSQINIIVLGGSFTVGENVEDGCCCNQDIKCVNNTCDDSILRMSNGAFGCSWSNAFYRWMKDQYPNINFVFSTWAGSGVNSFKQSHRLIENLHELKLSSSDIMFIDESVNDVRTQPISDIKIGVEAIIRKTMHYCNDTCPTIIMLDYYPHHFTPDKVKPSGNKNIVSTIYHDIAVHYKLPLWSYKDFVWSNFTQEHQPHLFDILISAFVHPPWYIHQLYAEIVVGCWLSTTSQCEEKYRSISDIDQEYPPLTLHTLPPPLYPFHHIVDNVCDVTIPSILDVKASSTFHPDNVTEYESAGHGAEAGWREYTDYHGIPGFIINAHSSPHNRVFSIPLNEIMLTAILTSSPRAVIKIVYLQTYVNAGKIECHICGTRFAIHNGLGDRYYIDALHHDHEHYKVSTPALIEENTGAQIIQICAAAGVKNTTLDIVYTPVEDQIEVRKDQKFKLMR
eukprot:gene3666-7305_t